MQLLPAGGELVLEQPGGGLRVGLPRAVGRAQVRDRAHPAGRAPGVADAPPVVDQPVGEHGPVLRREQRGDVVLHLHRILLLGEAKAAGQAPEVRVHGEPGAAEGVAQHHERGLAPHPRQGREPLEGVGDLAVVLIHEPVGQRDDRAGLGPVEAQGAHDLLDRLVRGLREILRSGVGGEQPGGDGVDLHIRGLRGEHGGHQQLERGVEVQLRDGVGVGLGEDAVDAPGPAHPPRVRLLLPPTTPPGRPGAGLVLRDAADGRSGRVDRGGRGLRGGSGGAHDLRGYPFSAPRRRGTRPGAGPPRRTADALPRHLLSLRWVLNTVVPVPVPHRDG
ncbi:Uncharacterised protein [Mycobacteroides abscessus subsp. abscessus]|nr:Uncharacterised protein [Mycobacteroides abscessus subsp. abscessus]